MNQLHQKNTALSAIDTTLPVEARINHYLKCSTNPYYLRIGDINVGIYYREGGASLQQKVIDLCNQSLEM